jgi:hypothetical protein
MDVNDSNQCLVCLRWACCMSDSEELDFDISQRNPIKVARRVRNELQIVGIERDIILVRMTQKNFFVDFR